MDQDWSMAGPRPGQKWTQQVSKLSKVTCRLFFSFLVNHLSVSVQILSKLFLSVCQFQFQFGGSISANIPASSQVGAISRPCQYRRVIWRFIRFRWVPVGILAHSNPELNFYC